MPPKRKTENHSSDQETPKKAKKSPKAKVTNDIEGEGEGEGEGGDESDNAKSPKSKPTKVKIVQSDYMPKEYPAENYDEPLHEDGSAYKIVSWNVNGLNACMEKGFKDYVKAENADILVIQETKLQDSKVDQFDSQIEQLGYPYRYWSCSKTKKGYAGTAIFSKIKPINIRYGLGPNNSHNDEGRTISCEYNNFHLINCYVPNSGQKLERLSYRKDDFDPNMLKHLQFLENGGISDGDVDAKSTDTATATAAGAGSKINSFFKSTKTNETDNNNNKNNNNNNGHPMAKPIIFTGDLNVAHTQLDIKNYKSNYNKTAGCCDDEIQGMTNYINAGYEDTYRRLYPNNISSAPSPESKTFIPSFCAILHKPNKFGELLNGIGSSKNFVDSFSKLI